MKKFFVALCVAFCALFAMPVSAATVETNQCATEAPYGYPVDKVAHGTFICHTAYTLKHDNDAKIPAWVSYTLTPEHTEGCSPRADSFAPDTLLPVGQRAEKVDYRNSGYDKGHIANNADMAWDPVVDRESFLLSNMTPQTHPFNAGIWKELETNVRGWAFNRKHTLLVYAGPIYNSSDKTIGPNKVVVPHAFYKIVVDTNSKETLAFLFPHATAPSSDLRPYLTSVDKVESATNIVFSVPSDKKQIGTLWPDDLNKLAKDKQAVCAAHTK